MHLSVLFLKTRISIWYFACKEPGTKAGIACMKNRLWGLAIPLVMALCACEPLDDDREEHVQKTASLISLDEVAELLASVPIGTEQMTEVMDAASSSAGNGYDEEYRMRNLFEAPGTGVGEEADATKAGERYQTPLRELLSQAVKRKFATKADDNPEEALVYLDSLSASDVQIYWPYSENWDQESLPIITYDPGDQAEENEGYALQPDGSVKKVMVNENMAREGAVWVVNRNADAQHKTLEMFRREDPSWGQGGGDIVVRPAATKAGEDDVKTLILRSFKVNRQFDSWFAGGAEFFVKVGAVENLNATTEAELRLYTPSITDFMVVVRRKEVGKELKLNTLLVSEWTGQLSDIALLCIEDDGGTRTSWKCSIVGKYNSKQYGFELEFPLNIRDDIVWRGSLTRASIEKFNGKEASFGDVKMVLELI